MVIPQPVPGEGDGGVNDNCCVDNVDAISGGGSDGAISEGEPDPPRLDGGILKNGARLMASDFFLG